MAKAKPWALTDLSKYGTLILKIEGAGEYVLTQCTLTFAINEIPQASCLVAVGRDVRTLELAEIHRHASKLDQMRRAHVLFQPRGEWEPSTDQQWTGPKTIFTGYFAGMTYRKVSGKFQPVLNLIHWLVDLGGSSVLSANHSAVSPDWLRAALVKPSLTGSGYGPEILYVDHLVAYDAVRSVVADDLWGGIKSFLCGLATMPEKVEIPCRGCGAPPGEYRSNERATRALKRIEGPGGECGLEYKYAKPLALNSQGIPLVDAACASAIGHYTFQDYARYTFWDVIVGRYCPAFSMILAPLVDRALVLADCPGYRTDWDKTIQPEEYDDIKSSGMLVHPLQSVGVTSGFSAPTGYGIREKGTSGAVCIGGYWAVDAQEASDGSTLVKPAPLWLQEVPYIGQWAGSASGLGTDTAARTTITDVDPFQPTEAKPSEFMSKLCQLYSAYAHSVYIQQMLAGRSATLMGKLRFDIAPGSILKVEPKPELFEPGVDELAVPLYGQVTRVTVNINGEASLCGTMLELNYVRSERENQEDRTSIDQHPLFGDRVVTGAPLVDDDWKFL